MRLHERAARTERVIARYRHRPFSWDGATCLHMARATMRALGERPPKMPRFRTAVAARRALKETGHESLTGLLDSLLPRIAPARMIVGDLAVLPSDDPAFPAVVVAAGGGKVLGWHGAAEGQGVVPVQIDWNDVVAAFAVGRRHVCDR